MVLQRKEGYDIFECKFYDHEMDMEEWKKEEEQVNNIKELAGIRLGFVNLYGFSFYNEQYELITGSDLYS